MYWHFLDNFRSAKQSFGTMGPIVSRKKDFEKIEKKLQLFGLMVFAVQTLLAEKNKMFINVSMLTRKTKMVNMVWILYPLNRTVPQLCIPLI